MAGLFEDMPMFEGHDDVWIWDPTSKSYIKSKDMKDEDRSHSTGGDNLLFDPTRLHPTGVPELEGFMAARTEKWKAQRGDVIAYKRFPGTPLYVTHAGTEAGYASRHKHILDDPKMYGEERFYHAEMQPYETQMQLFGKEAFWRPAVSERDIGGRVNIRSPYMKAEGTLTDILPPLNPQQEERAIVDLDDGTQTWAHLRNVHRASRDWENLPRYKEYPDDEEEFETNQVGEEAEYTPGQRVETPDGIGTVENAQYAHSVGRNAIEYLVNINGQQKLYFEEQLAPHAGMVGDYAAFGQDTPEQVDTMVHHAATFKPHDRVIIQAYQGFPLNGQRGTVHTLHRDSALPGSEHYLVVLDGELMQRVFDGASLRREVPNVPSYHPFDEDTPEDIDTMVTHASIGSPGDSLLHDPNGER